MSSTVITIPNEDEITLNKKKTCQFAPLSIVSSIISMQSKPDMRKVIHSIKVGIALVLVSLLYLLDPLYKQVGDNALWAIMTVVVIFEFSAGATLGKGLNRGIGTILGGGLGCLAAILADEVGGIGNIIIVGISVFVFGAAATYSRLVPSIKRRYEYGAVIFILTFNLVVVSGLRADKIIKLARERLSTICMGFAICIFINLLIFPMWASDELHNSLATRFEKLACCIEECLEEYFRIVNEKENQLSANFSSCKSVLQSKSNDESLVNFSRWEPWHGKFGFSYPWDKYQQIGDATRELAVTIVSLQGCLQYPGQPSPAIRQSIKEPCEVVGSSLVWTLRQLGGSIMKMERCRPKALMASKSHSTNIELSLVTSHSILGAAENGEGLAMASFVFLLMKLVEEVEVLAKEVDELGELASFQTK
ncbi:Aluminum-activated malate transporter like [Actinidia chinensis var. chinensis]|uniref:Aluminum-activated malate transporter like n=1 Tax=Actinidia chinensis var. chinensis TaxID=1590841 RepID=A0A2R6P5Z1_ACTCC|nr:Aluminum-activated malate transporter like [Actinidia chinensis var. chinensis]